MHSDNFAEKDNIFTPDKTNTVASKVPITASRTNSAFTLLNFGNNFRTLKLWGNTLNNVQDESKLFQSKHDDYYSNTPSGYLIADLMTKSYLSNLTNPQSGRQFPFAPMFQS